MKTLLKLSLVILLFTIQINAQSICGKVNYTHSTHFSRDFSREFTLEFNSRSSLYKEVVNKKSNKKESISQENEGLQLNVEAERNNLNPEMYLNKIDDLHFLQIWYDKELVVKEDAFQWNWDLKDETKTIGNFLCYKAKIEFRGRFYTAWYSPEIPIQFGPWKFQGLPGLILEVYDADRVLHIHAKKISLSKEESCSISYDESKFENPMTVDEYLIEREILVNKELARLSSKMPKGYKNQPLNQKCEDCKEQVEKFK
ncbi:GLPGLI family protein [Psychroflexus montanilacus]|uniref:GLPGLI family protein n=1 Tax=Psychroflexus montanilacus TaxID=2873598 RepID=UPI001CCC1211|nr:GLPGLI family protein [Psychroflexus montanilacus]MBZ9652428.1 GLPGLI family protein [Psychroflexus montanilacus]